MSNPSPSQVQQAESGGPCASLDSVKCILTHGGGPSWNRQCTNSTPVHGACQITSPLINLISESGGHLGFKSPESTPHFHSLVCRNRSQGTKRYTRQMLITQPPEQSVAGRGRKRRKGVGGVTVTPARLCCGVPAHMEQRTCLNTRACSTLLKHGQDGQY